MTSHGRWPQNIESWISKQPTIESLSILKEDLEILRPLIVTSSTFKFKLGDQTKLKWRQPQSIKIEYLSKTKKKKIVSKKTFNGSQPMLEYKKTF